MLKPSTAKLLRRLCWAAGIVVVVVLALAIGLRVLVSRHVFAEWLGEQASSALSGRVVLGEVHYRAPAVIEARDVHVYTLQGEEVASARRVVVSVGLFALLKHEVRVESLLVDGPKVSQRVAEVAPETGDGEPSTWTVSLGTAAIREAAVALDGRLIGPLDVDLLGLDYDPAQGVQVESIELRDRASRVTASGGIQGQVVAGRGSLDVSFADEALRALLPPDIAAQLATTGNAHLEVQGTSRRAEVRFEVNDVSFAEIDLASLEATLVYDGSSVTVDHLAARPRAGGRVSASGSAALMGAHALEIELEDLPLRDILSAAAPAGAVPATLSGNVTLHGDAPPWRDTYLALSMTGATPVDFAAYLDSSWALRGQGHLTPERLRLAGLRLQSGELVAKAQGSIGLQGALDIEVTARHTGLGKLQALADAPLELDLVEVVARVDGPVSSPRGRGTLGARALDRHGDPWSLTAPFALTGENLAVRGGKIVAAEGGGSIDGTLSWRDQPTVSATLGLHGLSLSRLTSTELAGTLEARAEARGLLAGPRVALSASARDVAFRDVTLASSITARGSFAGERLVVDELAAVLPERGQLGGKGHIDVDGSSLDATLSAQSLSLAIASGLVDAPLAGSVSLEAHVLGSVQAPRGSLSVDGRELRVRGVALGDMTVRATGDVQAVRGEMSIEGPLGRISAEGRYTPRTEQLAVQATGDVPGVRAISHALGQDIDADGHLRFDVDATGSLPYPTKLRARIAVDELVVAGSRLPNDLVVTVHDAADGYGAEATFGSAIVVTGHGKPGALDVEAQLQGLEAQSLAPQIATTGLTVRMSGHAKASYRTATGWRGEAQLGGLLARTTNASLVNDGPVTLAFSERELRVERLVLHGDRGITFSASGRVGATIDATMSGVIDAGFIAPFVPALSYAAGPIGIDAVAHGKLGAPEVDGTVVLRAPVTLRARALPREVRVSEGRIEAQARGRELELSAELRGDMGGGAFHVDGRGVIIGATPKSYSAHLTAQELPLRAPNLVIDANVDLTVSGDADMTRVAGRIDVTRGRYLRKFELRDFNFVARDTEAKDVLANTAPWLGRVSLDLQAVTTGEVEVRVDAGVFGMNALLDSDLHIGGTPLSPMIDGRVSTTHGELEFPKAKLELTQAVVEFSPGARQSVAQMDMRAEGEVTPGGSTGDLAAPTYMVQLTLTGSLQRMALELTSDPSLSRLEVLSLLVSGQANVADLARGDGDNSGSSLDAALAFAGSQLAQPLSNFVERQLERRLNLRLQLGAEVTSEGVKVTARKNVSSRLSIEGAYERSLGAPLTTTSASARLFFTDRLFLEGSTATSTGVVIDPATDLNQSRVELKWRLFSP